MDDLKIKIEQEVILSEVIAGTRQVEDCYWEEHDYWRVGMGEK